MRPPETLTLFVTRDLANGRAVGGHLERDDGELDCEACLDTTVLPPGGDEAPARPRLEVHRVRLGEPAEVVSSAVCRRRCAARRRRASHLRGQRMNRLAGPPST